jgi:hypothetical protein
MNFTQLICKFVFKQNCFIQFNYGKTPHLRTVNVTRYITPLREGGSLPAR